MHLLNIENVTCSFEYYVCYMCILYQGMKKIKWKKENILNLKLLKNESKAINCNTLIFLSEIELRRFRPPDGFPAVFLCFVKILVSKSYDFLRIHARSWMEPGDAQ